jgi:hypothetical protein
LSDRHLEPGHGIKAQEKAGVSRHRRLSRRGDPATAINLFMPYFGIFEMPPIAPFLSSPLR